MELRRDGVKRREIGNDNEGGKKEETAENNITREERGGVQIKLMTSTSKPGTDCS